MAHKPSRNNELNSEDKRIGPAAAKGRFVPCYRPPTHQNAAQCVERQLWESRNAVSRHPVKVGSGPFMSIDTKGGFRSLAAAEQASGKISGSSRSKLNLLGLRCCAGHQRQQNADCYLCKINETKAFIENQANDPREAVRQEAFD
ncbi:hypothetical protein [uncultured Pelagimonas sp.]|uniref:hypothetical protein n=1 Tax=uncultured Pelagimonas sp. TaxID=1618102 RepID=UPI00260425C6|nr:hypothetical protein [uncultured Pelagimonas sp.]